MSTNLEGLVRKYRIERLDDDTEKHTGCKYFVLDPQHDPAARAALAVYAAQSKQNGNSQLSEDLHGWLEQVRGPAAGAAAIGTTVDTAEALAGVPTGTVVVGAVGTIAARFDTDRGVVFGDNRPFAWSALRAPAVVLWSK